MEKTALYIEKYCGVDVRHLPADEVGPYMQRAAYMRQLAVSEIAEALSKTLT